MLCFIHGAKAIWEEQFGYVFVEAMSCGKPVVSTESGSIPEVVKNGETGLLTPPGNIRALSESIELLIKNKKLRDKMGNKARRLCLERYDSKKSAEQLAKIYSRVKA